jgi:sigma-B regulation protein RsbU (phosphoserine phosphatase)
VGGDYYDYYLRGADAVDLVVADVSGHSIGAALMTAEARSALRTQLASGGSAGQVLAALNRILYEDLCRAELFITLFCASYDAASRTLTYANAGHTLPLLFRGGDQSCRWLDAEGLILGVREEVAYEEKRLRMQEGDLLLLYTDGVTEAGSGSGELFGAGRLCDLLHACHQESPQAIIDAVLREIAAFAGGVDLEDDVTMVAMKVG